MNVFIIDSESLIDPRWLNEQQVFHVEIELEPDSDSSPYHHVYFVRASSIDSYVNELQRRIKKGWYAFSFHEDKVDVVFSTAIFSFSLLDEKRNFIEALEHGSSEGITVAQMNFDKYIRAYARLIDIYC